MKNTQILISITQIPEALAGMRSELARYLRDAAKGQPPCCEKKLREVADAFEAGLSTQTTKEL